MGNIREPQHGWESLEIDLLLECVYQRYGFDFRAYDRVPLRNRLQAFLSARDIPTFSALQDKIMHDTETGEIFLHAMLARTARLFDDPAHLQQLRDFAVPWLRSHPTPRIWIAESVTPEEVCALAILLDEEGLGEKTELFATGSNEALLRRAATCGVARSELAERADAHRASGGKGDLAQYFRCADDRAILVPRLRANITWAQFNLQSDASFNEFHLVVCRHVLHDFGTPLRHRVLRLFHDSLAMFGQLSMDGGSDMGAGPFSGWYRCLTPDGRLYKRIA
ncbi:MAG TPA: CheR family methyltransferase [Burkholderiaceae bacterium]|jgi:chemotaxis protein methyltransferase CheR